MKIRDELILLDETGEWTYDEKLNKKARGLGKKVLHRLGCIFDGHHGLIWWYGMWAILAKLVIAIMLPSLVTPAVNAGMILAVSALDNALIVFGQPNVKRYELVRDSIRGLINLATLSTIMGYIQGTLSEAWFTQMFMWLSVLSIIPAAIAPLVDAISGLFKMGSCCVGFACNLGPATTVAASAGLLVAAVAQGDDNLKNATYDSTIQRVNSVDNTDPPPQNSKEDEQASAGLGAAAGAGMSLRPLAAGAHGVQEHPPRSQSTMPGSASVRSGMQPLSGSAQPLYMSVNPAGTPQASIVLASNDFFNSGVWAPSQQDATLAYPSMPPSPWLQQTPWFHDPQYRA